MREILKALVFMAVAGCVCVPVAAGQDAPSLGDAARQARQQKQSKETQNKNVQAPAPKVLTNEDISALPELTSEVSSSKQNGAADSASAKSEEGKLPAEQWKSQIKAQKAAVAALSDEITKVNDSIQFAPGNCVSGCVQWNERQKQKQDEVERMRSQLDTEKKRLQDMQESARQQGYGSSVYDP